MQIVGYDTAGAGLLLSDGPDGENDNGDEDRDGHGDVDGTRNAAVRVVDLHPGAVLEYALGDRRCAGTIHDGNHVDCTAPDAPYCDAHSSTWVCARCTGTCLKDEMDCHEEHAVYLAAFAPDRFKVGVTKRWRLETRLREQGADRGAHVRTTPDGRVAREVEAGLAEATDLVDRVRVPTKRSSLAETVDVRAWNALLDRFDVHQEFDFDYGLDLAERPVAETMAAGTVVGTKGRILVLERGGSSYAIDMRDLVGYEVSEGRENRNLQSSLGVFG